MNDDILLELKQDEFRRRLLKYTRQAFEKLPKLDNPRILDIGCGTGVPTLELARLSRGEIIGIDIDEVALDKLKHKIGKIGIHNRIKTKKSSLFNIDFPAAYFDIIWTEGAIQFIGFERGLKEWWRFIKPNGFLVIHDEIGGIEAKINIIPICGYRFIDYFIISGDIWSEVFYDPYELRIKELQKKYKNNPAALVILDQEQSGVNKFRNSPEFYGSVFYIMQKSKN